MYLDALLKVAAAQQVTADAVSASSYDTKNVTPKRNIAAGEPMVGVVFITAIGTNTGSVKFQVIQSAAADLGSGTQILGEVDLAAADLVAGQIIIVPIGQGIPNLRYLGLNFDIAGTVDFTVDGFVPMPAKDVADIAQTYAKNYSV